MKTSVKWLENYVDIPWSVAELADRLTLAGLEVEDIAEIGSIPEGVVVAEILSRRPHPDADKLSLCDVSVGSGEPVQVVCGAPNCDAGARVPMATVGTVFEGGFKIKKAKLRGHVSHGMLCSARELGLGDDHSGLLILPADAPVGTSFAELVQSDTVVDWEVTPNRPDWLSHIGIAREIAALADASDSVRLPQVEACNVAAERASDAASVEVRDPDLCARYIARIVRNVTIGPSPKWMQDALSAVGMRPINNVVDITNFVLMECGQPLHAFDMRLLAQNRIVVRRAADGEAMVTLDGQEHELSSENLLIADAERGVALAGVMGGANSEINDDTTDVLLESAVFLPSNIRATAKTLGLGTESSYRFERGVDPEMAEYASRRAAALVCELAGGELLDGVIDVYPGKQEPVSVSCRFERIDQLLGVPVGADRAVDCLERLGLTLLDRSDDVGTFGIPSFRPDLAREVDLIEEVARLYGLDNIPGEPAPACVGGAMADDTYYPLQEAREQLLALGLDETMTYSLLGAGTATAGTGFTAEQLVSLANPLSSEAACMRPSVLPGVLATVAHNIAHGNGSLAVFELARVIANAPGLPEERWQAGIALTGPVHPERFGDERERAYDFFDMKGTLEGLLAERRVQGACCTEAEHPAFRSGACATMVIGDETVAVFGEVADALTADIRLKDPLFIALVELSALFGIPARESVYSALPQFPAVARDISLIAGGDLSNQAILDVICGAGGKWLENVELFDVYEDEEALGPGKRSLAYSLTYRHPERTLTDEQVNTAHEKVRRTLGRKLPVELR